MNSLIDATKAHSVPKTVSIRKLGVSEHNYVACVSKKESALWMAHTEHGGPNADTWSQHSHPRQASQC